MVTVAGVQIFAQGVVVLLAAVGFRPPKGSADHVGQKTDQLDAGVAFARHRPYRLSPPSSPPPARRRWIAGDVRFVHFQRGGGGSIRSRTAVHLYDARTVRPPPVAGSTIQRYAFRIRLKLYNFFFVYLIFFFQSN